MSLEIIQQIEQAEQQAIQIKQQALTAVQEITASEGASLAAKAQEAARRTRVDVQALLEDARLKTQTEIDQLREKAGMERTGRSAEAMRRVPEASRMIMESLLKGS